MQLETLIQQTAASFESTDLFYGHGTDNAWDEACWLVLSTLDLPFHVDPAKVGELAEDDVARVQHLADRRIKERVPVAYLTGEAWFCGQPYFVTEDTLIPRSPLGEFIHSQFAPWVQADEVKSILDIGTGSGCIAMAAAMAFPNATVHATDVSAAALAVAERNQARHNLNKLQLFNGSLFEPLPAGVKYDVVLSNPPYVPDTEMSTLPAEYNHEPTLALRADDDGLILALQILAQAQQYLTEDGIVVVEVGNSAEALQARLADVPLMWLEFVEGGDGVALLTYHQLQEYQTYLDQAVRQSLAAAG